MCDIHVTKIILDSNFLGPQNFFYPKIVLTHTFLIPIFLLISFWNQYPTQLKSQVWLSQLSLLSSSFKLQLSCTETAGKVSKQTSRLPKKLKFGMGPLSNPKSQLAN